MECLTGLGGDGDGAVQVSTVCYHSDIILFSRCEVMKAELIYISA